MDAVVLGVAVRDIQVELGRGDANSFRLAMAEVGQLAFDEPMLSRSNQSGLQSRREKH